MLARTIFSVILGVVWSLACACSGPPDHFTAGDSGTPVGGDASQLDASQTDAGPIDAGPIDAGAIFDAAPDALVEGDRLVYLADQTIDGVYEVFMARTDGEASDSYRVNLPLSTGMRVRDYALNDAGTMILYTAKSFEQFSAVELFAVDISGLTPGTPVRLHDSLPTFEGTPSSGVGKAEWVPGKNQIVFGGTLESHTEGNLYLVSLGPSGWGDPVKLNAAMPSGQSVQGFAIAPDGNAVVYRGPQETALINELYSVDLSGQTPDPPVRVSGPFPVGPRDVVGIDSSRIGYGWSPDSSAVFYLADQIDNNVEELFVSHFAGGVPQTPVRVNGALTGGDVLRATWSPDSTWIAYQVAQEGLLVDGLYIVAADTQVSGAGQLVSSGIYVEGASVLTAPVWAPDSSGIVFHATQLETGGQTTELFYVSISFGRLAPAIRLNGPLVNNGAVTPNGIGYETVVWAPEATHLVYTSDEDLNNSEELFLVRFSPDGPEVATNLSGPPPFAASDVTPALTPLSPDGNKLLFRANRDSSRQEVFQIDLSTNPPGAVTRVNPPMTLGGEASYSAVGDRNIQWSPAGTLIAYLADQEVNDRIEVFVVRDDQLGSSVRASAPLAPTGDVLKFEWVP